MDRKASSLPCLEVTYITSTHTHLPHMTPSWMQRKLGNVVFQCTQEEKIELGKHLPHISLTVILSFFDFFFLATFRRKKNRETKGNNPIYMLYLFVNSILLDLEQVLVQPSFLVVGIRKYLIKYNATFLGKCSISKF